MIRPYSANVFTDMKVEDIRKEVIYHVVIDGVSYKRYSPTEWVKTMYFDIMSEDYTIISDYCVELEELFQEYKELAN